MSVNYTKCGQQFICQFEWASVFFPIHVLLLFAIAVSIGRGRIQNLAWLVELSIDLCFFSLYFSSSFYFAWCRMMYELWHSLRN